MLCVAWRLFRGFGYLTLTDVGAFVSMAEQFITNREPTMRNNNRQSDQLREINFERNYTKYAEGSVLISCGYTKVLCNASVAEGLPPFLRGQEQGWLTAEYGMLPRATGERNTREAAHGKQTGRTQEIQRLLGRCLRAAVDLKAFPGYTITIDCDVLQADGGTRTAAITGACVALVDALTKLQKRGVFKTLPLRHLIAAVSVGICKGEPLLDLDYKEDSQAQTDMNVVMTQAGEFIEVQGTAEGQVFSETQLQAMLRLANKGIAELIALQRQVLDWQA